MNRNEQIRSKNAIGSNLLTPKFDVFTMGALRQRAVVMLHHSVAAQVDVEGFVKGSAQGSRNSV